MLSCQQSCEWAILEMDASGQDKTSDDYITANILTATIWKTLSWKLTAKSLPNS